MKIKILSLTSIGALVAVTGAVAGFKTMTAQRQGTFAQAAVSVNKNTPPEVRFVAAGIENARQKLRCAQAVLSSHQRIYKEYSILRSFEKTAGGANDKSGGRADVQSQKEDTEVTHTVQWYYQEPKIAMLVQPNGRTYGKIEGYRRLVADEKSAMIVEQHEDKSPGIKAQDKFFYIGNISSPETILANGLWKAEQLFDPRYYVYYWGIMPLDELLAANDSSPIFKGEEIVAGSRCLKIEAATSKDTRTIFWVDTEHSFLIRRQENYKLLNGKPALEIEVQVPRLLESNGIWFPAVIERKDFFAMQLAVDQKFFEGRAEFVPGVPLNKVRIEGGIASLPRAEYRITITDFKADCDVSPEVFTMYWPLGTNIRDNINQKMLMMFPMSRKHLAALNKIRNEQGQQDLTTRALKKEELGEFNDFRKQQGMQELEDAVAVVVDNKDLSALGELEARESKKAAAK